MIPYIYSLTLAEIAELADQGNGPAVQFMDKVNKSGE